MAISHIGRVTSEKINQEIDKTVQNMASGSATDFTIYRWMVGYIEGLKTALTLLDESENQ